MGELMDTEPTRFDALAERPYADVLIVGGGINGLATFRDLALQGVDVFAQLMAEGNRLRMLQMREAR